MTITTYNIYCEQIRSRIVNAARSHRGEILLKVVDWVNITIPLFFFIIQVFLHYIDTGFSPVRETISMYVWCGYGFLQTFSFYGIAFAMLFLTTRIYFMIKGDKRWRIGMSLLLVVSLGLLIVAVIPTRRHDQIVTWMTYAHVGTALFIAGLFPLALLLMAPSFKVNSAWKPLFTYFLYTAGAAIAIGIAGLIIIIAELSGLGIVERILMFNSLIWMEVVSIKLLILDNARSRK